MGVARTLARVNDPKNEELFQKLGVDITVSATSVIMAQIEQDLPIHPMILLMKLKATGLEVVEVQIPEDSRVVGLPVSRTPLPYQSLAHRAPCRRGRPSAGTVN